jgi:predicted DNA-binding transcriptional regulator YafY
MRADARLLIIEILDVRKREVGRAAGLPRISLLPVVGGKAAYHRQKICLWGRLHLPHAPFAYVLIYSGALYAMNRIDRLFGILLLLQRKRRVRAEDLARTYEISERTIYRDMLALQEIGVPIVSLPGVGYELVEGYYLPPLLFSPSEASALFLSARMLMAHTSGHLSADAESALSKIAVVLPGRMRQEAEHLAETIEFVIPPVRFDTNDARLATFQQAIRERRVVRLRYHSYNRDQTTERDIEPDYLTYSNGTWYINGYCRLRDDMRAFRFDRIERLELLADTFVPRAPQIAQRDMIDAHVRFEATAIRWVRERQHYAFQNDAPASDGQGIVMLYRVHRIAELLPWLLSWGAAAQALDPPELRDAIRAEVTKVLNFLT